jgi:hypothetical protein
LKTATLESTKLEAKKLEPKKLEPMKKDSMKKQPAKSAPDGTKPLKPPLSPKWVLLTAILLPGVGQLLNNAPLRGLLMIGFMLILGLITYNLAEPHISMVGKLAGGIFIYALSVMDAYYWARYRTEIFRSSHPQ